MLQNKKLLLLIPLILSIGIIPFIQDSYSQTPLEECRNGLYVVKMVSDERRSCLPIETAERWVELGIGIIVDPNYTPTVQEDEEEKLSIFQRITLRQQNQTEIPSIVKTELETPEPPTVEFNDTATIETFSQAQVSQQSETATEVLETTPNEQGKPDFAGKPEPKPPGKPADRPGFSGIKAEGHVVIEVFGQDGKKKFHREDHNLVVDIGLEALSDLAFGTTHVTGESAGGFSYISVGTGGTAPAVGNTDCETQHGAKKQDVSITNTALGAIINVSWVAELSAGTIQEICLTDNGAAATGNLFARQTYTGIPIVGTDTINAEWTITFADSNGT